MQNYSQKYAEALAEFVSPLVPADRGDEGKGQVNARAVYKINQINPNVGHIAKSAGQTQYHELSVDACLDRSDGTGADYLTDVDLGNGQREIRVAYTPYAPPPPGTPLPPANWVQPTAEQLTYGGPLTLKADSGGGIPDPTPTPPPADNAAVLARIDQLEVATMARFDTVDASLVALQNQQATDTTAILAAVQHFEDRFNQIIEDVEDTLVDLALLLLLNRRPERGAAAASSADIQKLTDRLQARIDRRRQRREERGQ